MGCASIPTYHKYQMGVHECDGDCSINMTCKGDTVKVRVVGPSGAEWGEFWYCETAIQKDRDAGFYVEEVKA